MRLAGLLMEEGAGERDSLEMTRSFESLRFPQASMWRCRPGSFGRGCRPFDEAYQLMVDQLLDLVRAGGLRADQYQQILSLEEER